MYIQNKSIEEYKINRLKAKNNNILDSLDKWKLDNLIRMLKF